MSDEIKELKELLRDNNEKLGKTTDALIETNLNVAVLATKFESVDQRGCAASIKANREMDAELKKIKSQVNRLTGVMTIITGIFTFLLAKLGLK